MDTALGLLQSARGERVTDALATLRARLAEQRTPLSRGQLDAALKGVATKFTPRSVGGSAAAVSDACLQTLAALAEVPGADVPAAWREALPDIVAALTVDTLRESATGLLRKLVATFDRFDVVGEVIIVHGLSSALSSQRAAAAACIPAVLIPRAADSMDYRRLLDALAAKLHDASASVIEACLKALGHLRNVDPSFDRQVKKLRYAHQQHITEHAEAIRHYASRMDANVTDGTSMGAKLRAANPRASRSLSISGVQISGQVPGQPAAATSTTHTSYGASPGTGTSARGSFSYQTSDSGNGAGGVGDGISMLSVHGAQTMATARTVRRTSSDLRRRSDGDLQFGFVPATVLAELKDERFEKRLRAADDLCLLVQSADSADLKASLKAFIRIPGLLVAERQYKLVMAGLTIVEILCDRCGSRIRQHMEHVVPGITHQLGATQVVLRKAAMRTFAKLMAAVGSTALLPSLLRATEHPRNAYIREAGCRLIILALLTNSSVRRFDFDPPSLVRSVAALLHDQSDRVRLCVMELLAQLTQRPPRGVQVDVLHLLRPLGLDPSSAMGRDLNDRLQDRSLPLPEISEDGMVVLPRHASLPDVPETPVGSFRGLDAAGDPVGMRSGMSSRSSRRGIPFDMPKRVGSSRAITSSRMSHRRPSNDGFHSGNNVASSYGSGESDSRSGLKLHIGDDEHKSFADYQAALGLNPNPVSRIASPDSDSSGERGAVGVGSRGAVSDVGPGAVGFGSGTTVGSAEVSRTPQFRRTHAPQGRGLSHVHQQQQQMDSPTGKSWLHDVKEERGSEPPIRARLSHEGKRGGAGGSSSDEDGEGPTAPIAYKPTRKAEFERRPVVPTVTNAPRRGLGRGRPRAKTDISVDVARDKVVRETVAPSKAQSPLILEREPSVGGSSRASDGGSHNASGASWDPPFSPMHNRGGGRGHMHLNGHGRPRRADGRKPPQYAHRSGNGGVGGADSLHIAGSSHVEPEADYTDILDSDDSDDKEVAGVVTGARRPSPPPAGERHTPTLPRTFSQAVTRADKEIGESGGGGMKLAFGSNMSGASSVAASQAGADGGGAVAGVRAGSGPPRNGRRAESKRNLLVSTFRDSESEDEEGRVVSVPVGGDGEVAPKKHLMTLINRRRMDSRNTPRAGRNNGPVPGSRRAASASSRVENQSQTPQHSRFHGYGYGNVEATERFARPANSAMGRHEQDNGSPPRALSASKKLSRTPDPSRHRPYWNSDGDGQPAWNAHPPAFGNGDGNDGPSQPVPSETPRALRGDDRPLRPMSNADQVYGRATADVSRSDPHPINFDDHVQPRVVVRTTHVSKATQLLRERRQRRQNGDDSPTSSVTPGSPAAASAVSPPRKFISKRPRATSAAQRKHGPGASDDESGAATETPRTRSALGFASASPGQSSGSEYIDTADLRPLPNPDKSARTVVSGLTSGEWQTQFTAINVMRALAIKHSDKFDGHLTKSVVHALLPLARSLRSGVAKNALLGFTDLFGGVGHSVERYLDSMVPLLVKKAADKLRILADAADAALMAMVENCGERQCLQALLSCTAKGMNNDVRNKCGRHLARLLCKLPGHRITSQPQINDIIRAVARQLSEGSEEPRMAAKFILAHLDKEGVLNDDILRCLSRPDSDKIKATVARGIKTDPRFLMVGGGGGSRASSRASSRAGGGFGRRPRRSSQERDRPPGSAGSSSSGRRSRAGDDDDDHAGSGSGISTRGARGSRGRVRRRVGSGPPMSATASSDSPQGREFTTLVEKMNSSDWRERDTALKDMVRFSEASNGFALIKANEIADNLYKRLSDGNSKVQATAVRATISLVPNLNKALENSIPQIVPPIAALMAAKQPRLVKDASTAMGLIVKTMDARCLAPVLCSQVVHGNPRTQAMMLKKLAELVPDLTRGRSMALINRNVIPAAFSVLQATHNKREVKHAVGFLIRTVASKVGSEHVMDAAKTSKLSESETEQLRTALGVM